MIHLRIDSEQQKGWFAGPWNSRLPAPVGWASAGIDEPHLHRETHEIYLVARGGSTALVNGQEVELRAGDMLAVEPGEAHTFLYSTPDYLHFVVHVPFVPGDKISLPQEV